KLYFNGIESPIEKFSELGNQLYNKEPWYAPFSNVFYSSSFAPKVFKLIQDDFGLHAFLTVNPYHSNYYAIQDELLKNSGTQAHNLLILLAKSDYHCRDYCIRMLGVLNVPGAFEIFEEILKDTHSLSKGAAIRGIGSLKDPRGVEILIKLFDNFEIDRNTIYSALRAITGEIFITKSKWLNWWEENKEKY
ncbi:MAG: HEAT repeat domain-containing protein, partial [Candidatus Aminicenantes bacterium]|nr:HEAT repeat domain-containing protein [Candidatus Aminicenantes bacterium]